MPVFEVTVQAKLAVQVNATCEAEARTKAEAFAVQSVNITPDQVGAYNRTDQHMAGGVLRNHYHLEIDNQSACRILPLE